jgi:HSP20 family protein
MLPVLFDTRLTELLNPAFGAALYAEARCTPRLPLDVRQDGDTWVLEAEVPGLRQDDLDIQVENGVLTISGERKTASDAPDTRYYLRERRGGKFSRSVVLPETADGERVTAELANGILTLRIPTREDAKPRRIPVN